MTLATNGPTKLQVEPNHFPNPDGSHHLFAVALSLGTTQSIHLLTQVFLSQSHPL